MRQYFVSKVIGTRVEKITVFFSECHKIAILWVEFDHTNRLVREGENVIKVDIYRVIVRKIFRKRNLSIKNTSQLFLIR